MLNLSAKRLFVFDFDGTLVASNAIKRRAYFEVTKGRPEIYRVLESLLNSDSGLDRFAVFQELARGFPEIDPAQLAADYTAFCEERIVSSPAVPGVYELLAALKRSGRTSVINSATPEVALTALVRRLPLSSFVAAVYGKPATKMENMERAMQIAKAGPQETVLVGDGEDDHQAARAIGCTFIAVQSDNQNHALCAGVFVRRLDEIIGWLRCDPI